MASEVLSRPSVLGAPRGPGFLETLSRHPVFRLGETERQAWEYDRARRLKLPTPLPPLSARLLRQTDSEEDDLVARGLAGIHATSSASQSSSRRSGPGPAVANDGAKPGDFWPDPASRARNCVPRRCLAKSATGDELFVAVGRRVRSINLREAKSAWTAGLRHAQQAESGDQPPEIDEETAASWISVVDYKTLVADNLSFPIRQLSLNPTGKMLAVAGDEDVAIVMLPRAMPSSSAAASGRRQVRCKSAVVGAFNHSAGIKNFVTKIGWHPLGDGGEHLMVMTVDGVLRMYDLASDYDEPEQSIPLTPSAHPGAAGGFGIASGDDEVVSFDVGWSNAFSNRQRRNVGWNALAVFSVTRGGDVYATTPVVPKRSILPMDFLDSLQDITEEKLRVEREEREGLDRDRSWISAFNAQAKWIRMMKQNATLYDEIPSWTVADDQERKGEEREDGATLLVRTFQERALSTPELQGPFLLQPHTAELAGEGGADPDVLPDASDIIVLHTEPCRALVVGFSDGKVDVYAEVQQLEAVWPKPLGLHELELPVLAVHKSIDLHVPCVGHITFTQNPTHADSFHVHHSAGVQSLVVDWVAVVQQVCGDEDASGGSADISRPAAQLRVGWVFRTMPLESSEPAPILGVVALDDAYVGNALLALTAACKCVSYQMPPRLLAPVSCVATPITSALEPSELRRLRLLTPPFEPPETLVSTALPRQAKIVAGGGLRGRDVLADEEGIRFTESIVADTRMRIRQLTKARAATTKRLELQFEVLRLQADHLHRARADLDACAGRLESQRARVAQAAARHRDLAARADAVAQALINRHQPTLSPHEERWFAELRQGEVRVHGSGAGLSAEEECAQRTRSSSRRYSGGSRQRPGLRERFEGVKKQVGYVQREFGEWNPDGMQPSTSMVAASSSARRQPSANQLQRLMTAISKETALLDRTTWHLAALSKRMEAVDIGSV